MRSPRLVPLILAAAVLVAGCGAAKICKGANPAKPRPVATVMPLGAAVDWNHVQSSPVYAKFFLDHFQWMTPENELKMDALEPKQGDFSFGTADAMVNWALAHHKHVHGHVLIWGQQLPSWLATMKTPSKATALALMKNYITTVMRHFRGRIGEWDVVNEAFDAGGGWISNVWYDAIGPAYLADAFRFARAADPKAHLCYNDNGIEVAGPHATSVLRVVARLRAEHLIDCVGVESHEPVPGPPEAAVAAQLKRFAATGVQVHLSELDVKLASSDSLTAQARVYTDMARACRSVSGCTRVTTWGFTDATSWYGASARALPFNTACRAKPAWTALEHALAKRRRA